MHQHNPVVLFLAAFGAITSLFLLGPIALDLVGPAQDAIDQTRGTSITALATASIKKVGLDVCALAGSAIIGGAGGAAGGDYLVKRFG